MIMEVAVGTHRGYKSESQNVGESWDPTVRVSTSLCANSSSLSVKLSICWQHIALQNVPSPPNASLCTLGMCTKQK